ncbi:MAG TPA: polysaccharide deacetylase family protein [Clostridiales bacterium]|mgnify:CR=1 FL=1|nr:polysaccharide deacetylase family protein [Clostridiales bacterium]
MSSNKKLKILSAVIFLLLGITLGIISARENKARNPEDMQYRIPEITNNEFSATDINKSHSNNSFANDPVEVPQEDKDREVDENLPPDEKYYRKARVLQERYPDLFKMDQSTNKKRVALTFDDGPDGRTTPKILDILKENKITATFFLIGQEVKRYPHIIRRMIDEGHQIANHSWSHLRPTLLTDSEFLAEVTSAQQALEDCVDLPVPSYYRPPYGLLTPSQIEQIGEKGYVVISWSIDSLDWTGSESEEIQNKVISSVYPGAIILLHCAGGKDWRFETTKALPRIIEILKEQGYEFTTIDALLSD